MDEYFIRALIARLRMHYNEYCFHSLFLFKYKFDIEKLIKFLKEELETQKEREMVRGVK